MIVLLVDGDSRSRRAVRTFLENREVRVVEAEDLQEAREACGRSHPGAIVTEVFGDAGETLSRLGSLAPDVPVLVWTGSGEAGVEGRVRRVGAGFLRKPALPSEVAFALGRISPSGRTSFFGRSRPPLPALRERTRQQQRPAAS